MRTFETGATRDDDTGKLQYTEYYSPAVLRRYAEYIREHCVMEDGSIRSGDNWKKGMPYLPSLIRHAMELWQYEEHEEWTDKQMEDTLCAIMFNAMGLLYEKITRPST